MLGLAFSARLQVCDVSRVIWRILSDVFRCE